MSKAEELAQMLDRVDIEFSKIMKVVTGSPEHYLTDVAAELRRLSAEVESLRSERTALLVNEQNLEEAVKRARVDALTDAAKACELISVDKWALYKGREPYTGQEPGRAADFTQGQSDGAELCEQAIESLKGKP